jgi:D-glycero-D-manno-heptose 1,7-bisphosphate phosphatase
VTTPAVFLDRDGVINDAIPGSYVLSRSQFRFLPRARDALRFLAQNFGGEIVIVTNQPSVERGKVTWRQVDAMHAWMVGQIEEAGGRIDRIYVCPHRTRTHCGCRKPKPGLFLRAERAMELDLSRSVMVGDTLTDMQAARAAGITECYRVSCGLPFEDPPQEADTYTIVGTLSEAVVAILGKERS